VSSAPPLLLLPLLLLLPPLAAAAAAAVAVSPRSVEGAWVRIVTHPPRRAYSNAGRCIRAVDE